MADGWIESFLKSEQFQLAPGEAMTLAGHSRPTGSFNAVLRSIPGSIQWSKNWSETPDDHHRVLLTNQRLVGAAWGNEESGAGKVLYCFPSAQIHDMVASQQGETSTLSITLAGGFTLTTETFPAWKFADAFASTRVDALAS